MRREISWPLVGREEELAIISDLIDLSVTHGLVIAGAAGSGKSRLASETMALASDAGWPVLQVVASRAAATVPLGVFAPLLPARHDDDANVFEGLRWAADALIDRAGGRRMLLVVDDAHLLDPASATLVHQLAVGEHVSVVATIRSGEPAPDAVVALWKDGLALRLELQVLSHEETAALLRRALGGEVDVAAAHGLWVATVGNPLFLRELVRASVEAGVLVDDRGVWTLRGHVQIPPSIEDLVRQRLADSTPPETNAMYTLAFADVVGLALMRTLHPGADLAAMETRGLIRVDRDDKRTPITLTHPLYGEVLRALAPGTTAIDVARRLTDAVEDLGARRREDALRVATWRLVTGGEADPGLLATAAQQAYHAADFHLAERLARAALAGHTSPSVTVLLAQLVDERGEHAEAESHLSSLDLTALAPALRMRAALARADNLFFGLGREYEALEVLSDARGAFDDAPAGELVANQAWIDLHAGRPVAAVERLEVISPEDARGQVAAGIVGAWAAALLGDSQRALRAASEAAAREQPPDYPAVSRHEGFPELARGHALLHAGRLAGAEEVARAGLAAALTGGPPFLQARWTSLLGAVLMERGVVVTAAAAYRQASARQRKLGQTGQLRANLAGQALASAQAGDESDAVAALEELDDLPTTPERLFDADVLSAKAWLAAVQGHRSRATLFLRQAAVSAREAALVAIESRVQHDLIRLGEDGEVAGRLALLAEIHKSAACAARAHHAAAKVDGAGDRLEQAAARLEEVGLLLLGAEAFAEAAAAHARSGSRRANACHRRAARLLAGCDDARPPTMILEDHAARLTPREQEVVMMAARGMTSRQIAERLIISLRTVNNLIQHAYVKLGVHNRREAAAALGLDPERSSGSEGDSF
jgi:DNA-binding CsgD family transcriptional regulator